LYSNELLQWRRPPLYSNELLQWRRPPLYSKTITVEKTSFVFQNYSRTTTVEQTSDQGPQKHRSQSGADRNTDPSFTVWGPMQLRASQLRNPSTMDFPFWNPTNSELQVPATHASSAHQAPRFVQSLSGAQPGAALFDPTRSHTTLYNHQPARKESHFPHGDGQRIPGTGQPGTFQCDKSSQSQQLFFVLLISMQVWSRQFQSVSSRSGSTITPKPRVSHNS
jgi:hypothetical protein